MTTTHRISSFLLPPLALALATQPLPAAAADPTGDLAKPAAVSTTALPDWKDYMASLGAIGDQVIGQSPQPDNPQDRQDSWQMMFAQLARGFLDHAYADPDYPEFVPYFNIGLNVAAPDPDYIYYGTPIDGHGIYRLRGFMGTNRFTFLQFTGSDLTDPHGTVGMLEGYALNDFKAAPDGSFELMLSAERPSGYTGNWRRLDPRSKSLFVRAAAYDWLHERDPAIGIERMDRPVVRPRPTATEIAGKLSALADFVKEDTLVWWRHMADLQRRQLWNRIGVEPWGTFPGQVYLEGLYRIADDEALIIETDVPKNCRYWSFLVGDMQFRTVDWENHQSSLNGFQAKLDSDGKFRAVISRTDPGVPNWLDPGGYRQGVIQGRWNLCDSEPLPTTKLVKLSELRHFLPKDTPVVSAAQRDSELRDRHLGAQLRRKW